MNVLCRGSAGIRAEIFPDAKMKKQMGYANPKPSCLSGFGGEK